MIPTARKSNSPVARTVSLVSWPATHDFAAWDAGKTWVTGLCRPRHKGIAAADIGQPIGRLLLRRLGCPIGGIIRFLFRDREDVNLRQRDVDADAGEVQRRIPATDRLEAPGAVGRQTIDVQCVFILVNLDDLADAFDNLQIQSFPVPRSPLPHLRWRHDLKHNFWVIAAADHRVRNPRRIALPPLRYGAATDFGTAPIAVAKQPVAEGGRQPGQDGSMIRAWRRVRDNLAVDQIVAPGVAKRALVGGEKFLSRPAPLQLLSRGRRSSSVGRNLPRRASWHQNRQIYRATNCSSQWIV